MNISSALSIQDRAFSQAKRQVARVLLDFAVENAGRRNLLAQRDIAAITGKDWKMVHLSLESLDREGVIRIERNRITINKELLRKIARCSSE
jgi:hypothetical protein